MDDDPLDIPQFLRRRPNEPMKSAPAAPAAAAPVRPFDPFKEKRETDERERARLKRAVRAEVRAADVAGTRQQMPPQGRDAVRVIRQRGSRSTRRTPSGGGGSRR